tara:strand:- start:209 stop:748 length:540 start_codon:yes stop_codon:yes gene_type:complete
VNKSEIRKKILKKRKQNNLKKFMINYKNLLKIFKKFKLSNKIVGGYYPYNFEINSIEILEELEKKKYKISLPKIKKNFQMDFFQWSLKDPLTINKYGIPEPTSNKIVFPSILFVPLVAFDNHLNRIGYGGGFYDRYIKKIKRNKNVITIGLAYSFQKVREIKTNHHDIKLDFIITEKEN